MRRAATQTVPKVLPSQCKPSEDPCKEKHSLLPPNALISMVPIHAMGIDAPHRLSTWRVAPICSHFSRHLHPRGSIAPLGTIAIAAPIAQIQFQVVSIASLCNCDLMMGSAHLLSQKLLDDMHIIVDIFQSRLGVFARSIHHSVLNAAVVNLYAVTQPSSTASPSPRDGRRDARSTSKYTVLGFRLWPRGVRKGM